MDAQKQIKPNKYSSGHKLQVVVAFGIAVWILSSMWSHVAMSMMIISGPRPVAIHYRLGFPVTDISYGITGTETGVPGGNTPGIGQSVSSMDSQQTSGLDISYVCEGHGENCICLIGKIIPVPSIFCFVVGIFLLCYLLAVILDVILQWICIQQWVQEPISWTECRERDCAWWDVWCWANQIWCYVVNGFRWVLQTLCSWRQVIVWGTFIACVIGGIVIVLAML